MPYKSVQAFAFLVKWLNLSLNPLNKLWFFLTDVILKKKPVRKFRTMTC